PVFRLPRRRSFAGQVAEQYLHKPAVVVAGATTIVLVAGQDLRQQRRGIDRSGVDGAAVGKVVLVGGAADVLAQPAVHKGHSWAGVAITWRRGITILRLGRQGD